MLNTRWMIPTLASMLWAMSLGGCFFVIDDPHDYGSDPVVYDNGDTFWFCEYDAPNHDYYWEYQAEVWDADGLGDIRQVDVTFYDSWSGDYVDQVEMFDEGGGIWGAWSWERETALYCGDVYDVVFYVEDWDGNSDSLVLGDAHNAPSISESPIDTWADCFESGHDWVFEFQAVINDADGFTDVDRATVSFANYSTGTIDGEYTLNYEGDGLWGGWIEEGNGNNLYCGDMYEVTFYAEDVYGLFDTFTYTFSG
jgi:hypothetical protein